MSESIILIGNANVKENELFGETIDSFDNVVRFNRFETKNYEKYIGKKTTHWILNQDLYGKGLFEKKLQGDFDVKRYVITGAVPTKNTNINQTQVYLLFCISWIGMKRYIYIILILEKLNIILIQTNQIQNTIGIILKK